MEIALIIILIIVIAVLFARVNETRKSIADNNRELNKHFGQIKLDLHLISRHLEALKKEKSQTPAKPLQDDLFHRVTAKQIEAVKVSEKSLEAEDTPTENLSSEPQAIGVKAEENNADIRNESIPVSEKRSENFAPEAEILSETQRETERLTVEEITPAKVEAPSPDKSAFSKLADWFLLTGDFAPQNMSREYALASHWLLRSGVLIVLLGVAFFLGYAIDNGMLGPSGRFVLTLGTSVAVLIGGMKLSGRKYDVIGQALIAVALVMAYFDFYAGAQFLKLFSAEAALASVCVVSVAGSYLSIRENLKSTILFVITGAYATLVLLTTTENPALYHGYLVIVSVGFVVVSVWRNWPWVALINFVIGVLLCARLFFVNDYEIRFVDLLALCFVNITYPVAATILSARKSTLPSWVYPTLVAASSVTLLCMVGIDIPYSDSYAVPMSWLSLASALLFVAFSVVAYRTEKKLFMSLQTKAFLFLAASAYFAFTAPYFATAWSILATIAILAAEKSRLDAYISIAKCFVALLFLTWTYALYDFNTMLYKHAIFASQAAYRILLFPATLGVLLFAARKLDAHRFSRACGIAMSVSLAISLPFVIYAFFRIRAREFSTIAYTVSLSALSLAYIVAGLLKNIAPLRKLGLFMLFFAAAKLLFVDLAYLSTLPRVAAFVVVGLILIGGATLYIKFSTAIEKSEKES